MGESQLVRWLREQLRIREWSQSDFARRLGVGTGTVSRWMNGRQPETRYCDLIADAFGVDVDLVLTLAGHRPVVDPVDPDDRISRLVSLLRRVDLEIGNRGEGIEDMLRSWAESDRRERNKSASGAGS